MPSGTFEIVTGLALVVLVIVLGLAPAYRAGKDISGAVDVVATRSDSGVLVRLTPFPMTKGVVVTSVGVGRALADQLGLEVPDGYRWAVDNRWLSAEGRIRLREPVELFFAATKQAANPAAGVLRVVSRYRPGIRTIPHYVQVNIRAADPNQRHGATAPPDSAGPIA